jgi:hypothetical protein
MSVSRPITVLSEDSQGRFASSAFPATSVYIS